MKLRNIALTAAALGMATAPVAAESLRDAAPVSKTSELEGNSDLFLVLGAVAVIAGVIIIASGDDEPISG